MWPFRRKCPICHKRRLVRHNHVLNIKVIFHHHTCSCGYQSRMAVSNYFRKIIERDYGSLQDYMMHVGYGCVEQIYIDIKGGHTWSR